MLRTKDTHREFEALARAFLRDHPEYQCRWLEVANAWGGRTDLICDCGASGEVFASLTSYQIAVGRGDEHTDFEDFGRGLTDEQVAQEAFGYFQQLLSQGGQQ